MDKHMTKEQWLEFQAELFDSIKDLTRKKNADYTGGTDDPFANFREAESFGVPTLVGLSVRMGDKFQRIKSYCANGVLEAEGLEDAYMDMIGYSALALGILKEQSRQVKHNPTFDDEWETGHFGQAMENVQ